MSFLKQPIMQPFLCYKSATIGQIESNMVSNSKLKSDLCSSVITKIIESTAHPQQPRKRGSIFLDPL